MARRSFVCGAALVVALLATGATAQPISQSNHAVAGMRSFKGDKDTLINRIKIVEALTGGRVLEIRYTDKGGMPGYHVVVAKGGGVVFLQSAAEGRDVVEITGSDKPDWMLHWGAQAQLAAAQAAKTPLTDAISTAENAGYPAPAVAAGIATSANNLESDVGAYNILILQDGGFHRVVIDAATGQIIGNPRALTPWPGE
jgi:uncharacterized membrane protein YkoI